MFDKVPFLLAILNRYTVRSHADLQIRPSKISVVRHEIAARFSHGRTETRISRFDILWPRMSLGRLLVATISWLLGAVPSH